MPVILRYVAEVVVVMRGWGWVALKLITIVFSLSRRLLAC